MHRRAKINVIIIAIWILIILIYQGIALFLDSTMLEYREWVNTLYVMLVWFIPLALIGSNLGWSSSHAVKHRKIKTTGFIFYCVIAVLVFFVAVFVYLLAHDTEETKLTDGNYRVSVSTGFPQVDTEYYYTEPAGIFLRKRFEWSNEKYADSLSAIYHADFYYVGNTSEGDPQFAASEYFDIPVTVYGISDYDKNELVENLQNQITAARLKEQWNMYFGNGETLSSYGKERNYPFQYYETITSITINQEQTTVLAADLSNFIQNECENALRQDGVPLYQYFNGVIYILFQSDGETTDDSNIKTIQYGTKTYSWIYDATVTYEDILSKLE